MDVSEAIAERKSIRAYQDKPVDGKDLEKIIEAGRWAPNAGEFQMSVVRNPELLQKINDRTHKAMLNSGVEFLQERASLPGYQPLYGAPVLILLTAPDNPNSPLNVAAAAENMLLQATESGLGSCFLASTKLGINGEENRDLAREAKIPENHSLQCAVIVGHAAAENKFSPSERTKRGSVTYID